MLDIFGYIQDIFTIIFVAKILLVIYINNLGIQKYDNLMFALLALHVV